jgi:hypothetical protein
MSEEYTLLQYDLERLKKDLLYWRKVASDAQESSSVVAIKAKDDEIRRLNTQIEELQAENDDFGRLNHRIWETAKVWIREDSAIISKQAAQIKYLVAKLKQAETTSEAK